MNHRKGQATAPRRVSISAVAVLISEGNPYLLSRLIKNEGATVIYLGTETVTASGTTQGYPLAAGTEFLDEFSNGNLYAVSATGGEIVCVWEVLG